MPRTIARMCASHQAASALRAKGRPTWVATVKVKDLLTPADDRSAEAMASRANAIGKRLRSQIPSRFLDVASDDFNWPLLDAVEEFEACSKASLEDDWSIAGMAPGDMLDQWLEVLYDWADDNRVWIC